MASVPFLIFWILVAFSTPIRVLYAQNTTTTRISIPELGDVVGVTRLGPTGELVMSVYRGIPYAEAPVGPLRFSKPQSKRPWVDATVLDATKYGPICIPGQFGQGMYRAPDGVQPQMAQQSEDCLTLNIFVPDDGAAAENGLLPVMIWIHGGGFVVGAGSNHDGSVLAEEGRVLVVTLNYRVGVFGFFSTGDDAAPGNYGLWDQRLAINWVKDHIGSFGGDPNRITLFGSSAGGKAVAMQTATPVNNRTLFQRAIMESGATDSSAVNSPEKTALRSRQLAELLKCDTSKDSRVLVACLRDVSTETLVYASNHLPVEFIDYSPFYPTIDGDFFPDYIPNIMATGSLGQYDVIMGVSSDEGTLIQSSDKIPSSVASNKGVSVILEDILVSALCGCTNAKEASEAVAFYYTSEQGTNDGRLNRGAVLDAYGDALYTAPCLNNARHHVRANLTSRGNIYVYLFSYRPEDEPSSEPDIIKGAGHGAEVSYVFGDKLRDHPGTEKGNLSALMIRYWANFARNGDPNEDDIPYWPQHNFDNESYIVLQPNIDVGRRLRAGKISLWLDYLPRITEPSDPNTCSLNVPVPSGITTKPAETTTVHVVSASGDVLGSAIGEIRMANVAVGGRDVAMFMGIPYAVPPVDELRFRPPKLVQSWGSEPLDLRGNVPSACPQDTTRDPWMARFGFNNTSEDCLTLNIYAPMQEDGDAALPVLVFIHPGDLLSGTSSIYDATPLASNSEAVVVSFNYRLGALGFLSTEDEIAPGNYGLHDALAALQWVQQFITSFGGNPNRVTVVGHGAGSVLAHLLVLTGKSNGLLKQAIFLSGTALSPYLQNAVQPGPLERAKVLAQKLGCPPENSQTMIECLRDKAVMDLVTNTPDFPFSFSFPVVVDGDVLKESPAEILKSGNFQQVDSIFGMMQDEQAALAASFFEEDETRCPNETDIADLVQGICRNSFPNPELASLSLTTEYLDNGQHKPEDEDCPMRGSFRKFLQDYLTTAPTVQAAVHHAAAANPVFFYSFDHLPMDHHQSQLPLWAGPAFGDDLQFLFGNPYNPRINDDQLRLSYRLKDKRTSLNLIDLLSDFVHNGSPGISRSVVAWPSFLPSNLHYLSVDPCPDVRSGVDEGLKHKLRYWSELLATINTNRTTEPRPTFPGSSPEPGDIECVIGTLGLQVSPEVASTLIEALLSLSVAVNGLLILVVIGACIITRGTKKNQPGMKMEMDAVR